MLSSPSGTICCPLYPSATIVNRSGPRSFNLGSPLFRRFERGGRVPCPSGTSAMSAFRRTLGARARESAAPLTGDRQKPRPGSPIFQTTIVELFEYLILRSILDRDLRRGRRSLEIRFMIARILRLSSSIFASAQVNRSSLPEFRCCETLPPEHSNPRRYRIELVIVAARARNRQSEMSLP